MSLTASVVAACMCVLFPLGTQEEKSPSNPDPLLPLARFVGTWETHGKWSDGKELHARSVYRWGVNRKMILGKTFIKDQEGKEYQRYEEMLFWHPGNKRLQMLDIAFNGQIGEVVIQTPTANTLHFGYVPFTGDQLPRVRQQITFENDDAFVWMVEVKSSEGWNQLIKSTWRRTRGK